MSFAVMAQDKITVFRDGNELLVRSDFSPEKDLVLYIWRNANERAYLIPKTSDIRDYAKGEMIHNGGDDFAASGVTRYGYLGGNHGSSYGRSLTIPNHGLSVKDIGTKLTDETGAPYYIIAISDKDHVLIHPDGGGKLGFPKFKSHKGEKLFRDGQPFPFEKSKMEQMGGVRVNEIAFLVNGRDPLPDKQLVECDFLDHIIDADTIIPDAIVEKVKANPGKICDMFASDLPALFNSRTIYQYQPRGACVLRQRNTITHDFAGIDCLATIFCWSGDIANKKKEAFYIPKLKPMKVKGFNGAPDLYCDFAAIYDMPKIMDVCDTIDKTDCLDPEDPPDRFIRLAGDNEPELGFAIGYSLIDGCTDKERKAVDRPKLYFPWKTKKLYPYCYSLKNPKKGDERTVVAYRQYFNPRIEPDATAFYCHRQGDVDVAYMDFHKNLKDKTIRLPEKFVGKKLTIIEKTPSVSLKPVEIVPKEGITLSVKDGYGYLVIGVD